MKKEKNLYNEEKKEFMKKEKNLYIKDFHRDI